MADLRPGLHAVCALLRYSGPDIEPARVSGVLRAAFRDSPDRLARDGFVSLHCAAAPAPFVQTFRRLRDVLANEWAMVVMALVEVHEHPVPESRLVDVFFRTAQSFGASIDREGVRLIVEQVPDAARAASAGPFAPRSYDAPFERWRSTPAPGEAGHVPLPGCGSPAFRVPRQAAGAPPQQPSQQQATQAPTPRPPDAPDAPPPSYPAPSYPAPVSPRVSGLPPETTRPPASASRRKKTLIAGAVFAFVSIAAAAGWVLADDEG